MINTYTAPKIEAQCEAHLQAPAPATMGAFLGGPVCWGDLEQCLLCGRLVCMASMLCSGDEYDVEGTCDDCSNRLFESRN